MAEPVAATAAVVFSIDVMPQYPVVLTPAMNSTPQMVSPKSLPLIVLMDNASPCPALHSQLVSGIAWVYAVDLQRLDSTVTAIAVEIHGLHEPDTARRGRHETFHRGGTGHLFGRSRRLAGEGRLHKIFSQVGIAHAADLLQECGSFRRPCRHHHRLQGLACVPFAAVGKK